MNVEIGARATWIGDLVLLVLKEEADGPQSTDPRAASAAMFWAVVMPLARPAWATLTISAFIQTWNVAITPLTYARRESMRTLVLAIQTTGSQTAVARAGAVAAASFLMVVPTVVVFVWMQRRVIETVAYSAIKGWGHAVNRSMMPRYRGAQPSPDRYRAPQRGPGGRYPRSPCLLVSDGSTSGAPYPPGTSPAPHLPALSEHTLGASRSLTRAVVRRHEGLQDATPRATTDMSRRQGYLGRQVAGA